MKNKKWEREDILANLAEFKTLYKSKPISDNNGGMKSPHMFPAWYIVKKLKPKFLIESGVWKGLGTWFFENASPETKIISIDPEPRFRVYTSDSVEYMTEDFLTIDWTNILDPSETLVFFDDHQNCLPRLKRCNELGFKKIIVEDNYPANQGDCYTPKKILSQKDYVIDAAGQVTHFTHNPQHFEVLSNMIDVYQEMPPIFKAISTRWGDAWTDENYPTPEPLLSDGHVLQYKEFSLERLDYTWICYIELK